MKILFEQKDEVLIASLTGKLDAIYHHLLGEKVNEKSLETTWSTLLFDLSELDYISSAGFREFFLIGHKLQQYGKKMAICSLKPSVQKMFEIAMFSKAYPVFDSRKAALEN